MDAHLFSVLVLQIARGSNTHSDDFKPLGTLSKRPTTSALVFDIEATPALALASRTPHLTFNVANRGSRMRYDYPA